MPVQAYQEPLRHLVRALSTPNREQEMAALLAPPSTTSRVKMFVDGNLEKRRDKLEKQLEFLTEAFPNLADRIVEFIRTRPLKAYASAVSDGDQMLQWLSLTVPLTPLQRDYIACQRARHQVEELARRDRLAYVRFQELASVTETLLPQLGSRSGLRIRLNPMRVWGTFETCELVDAATSPPINVLFFGTRGEIATAVLELEGQALLNELVDFQPCGIEQWASLSSWADRDELIAFCRDLAEIGLVAIA